MGHVAVRYAFARKSDLASKLFKLFCKLYANAELGTPSNKSFFSRRFDCHGHADPLNQAELTDETGRFRSLAAQWKRVRPSFGGCSYTSDPSPAGRP